MSIRACLSVRHRSGVRVWEQQIFGSSDADIVHNCMRYQPSLSVLQVPCRMRNRSPVNVRKRHLLRKKGNIEVLLLASVTISQAYILSRKFQLKRNSSHNRTWAGKYSERKSLQAQEDQEQLPYNDALRLLGLILQNSLRFPAFPPPTESKWGGSSKSMNSY